MRTVKQVSQLTGVSVRTLHHYHAIGLLHPTATSPAGYRLYNDAALARLQTILLLRELEFPLKDIKAILDNPHFEPKQALEQQIRLLELERQRIDNLLTLARELQQTGGFIMNFKPFQHQELNQYKEEAKARWGNTEAYREFEARQAKGQDFEASGQQMMELFAELGRHKHQDPAGPQAQQLVAQLQQFITDHFYPCTKEILASLGQMYQQDERFHQNIDRAGGEGTAAFARQAIEFYCTR